MRGQGATTAAVLTQAMLHVPGEGLPCAFPGHDLAPGHTFLYSHLVLVFQSILTFLILKPTSDTLNSSKGIGRRAALDQPFYPWCAPCWPGSRD